MSTNLPPIDREQTPVKTKATKAWVGAIIAAAVAALGALNTAVLDNEITPQDWLNIVVSALIALGGVGGSVYVVTNKPKG